MATYSINNNDQNLNKFNSFRNYHGNGENGFETIELAGEYAKLKREWWGSNLVILETIEKEGRFYPQLNVFD